MSLFSTNSNAELPKTNRENDNNNNNNNDATDEFESPSGKTSTTLSRPASNEDKKIPMEVASFVAIAGA